MKIFSADMDAETVSFKILVRCKETSLTLFLLLYLFIKYIFLYLLHAWYCSKYFTNINSFTPINSVRQVPLLPLCEAEGTEAQRH